MDEPPIVEFSDDTTVADVLTAAHGDGGWVRVVHGGSFSQVRPLGVVSLACLWNADRGETLGQIVDGDLSGRVVFADVIRSPIIPLFESDDAWQRSIVVRALALAGFPLEAHSRCGTVHRPGECPLDA